MLNFDYLKCTRMNDFTLFIAEYVYHSWRNFEFWRPEVHQNEGFYCTWFLAEHLHHGEKFFLDIDYLKWDRMKDFKWQLINDFRMGYSLYLLTIYWHFTKTIAFTDILLTFSPFRSFYWHLLILLTLLTSWTPCMMPKIKKESEGKYEKFTL